jgi:hypothetical protein
MPQVRFRALIKLAPRPQASPQAWYDSGTRLLLTCTRPGEPLAFRNFQAIVISETGGPLKTGVSQIATIAVTGDDATACLPTGQRFVLTGHGTGTGIVTRRAFTDHSPS